MRVVYLSSSSVWLLGILGRNVSGGLVSDINRWRWLKWKAERVGGKEPN